MITLFLCLVFGHFVFDYPLQGDFLSKAKNHLTPIPGVPWYQALFAHSFMHAFVVYFFTGMISLLVLEFLVHAYTDHMKCKGVLSFNQDQFIHIFSKVIWVAIYFMAGGTA